MKSIREIFNRKVDGEDPSETETGENPTVAAHPAMAEESGNITDAPPEEEKREETATPAPDTMKDTEEQATEEPSPTLTERIANLKKQLLSLGIEEERAEKGAEKIRDTILSILDGELTEGMAEDIMRLAFFDEEIAAARREGEIAGRNARIEEHLRTTFPQENAVPRLESNGGARSRGAGGNSIFDLAYSAK